MDSWNQKIVDNKMSLTDAGIMELNAKLEISMQLEEEISVLESDEYFKTDEQVSISSTLYS